MPRRWLRFRRRAGVAIGLAAGAVALSAARSHPMHTSVVELRASGESVTISVRLFADDFAGVLDTARAAPDSVASAYVRGALVLASRAGRAIPLRWRGLHRVGDTVQLEFTASAVELGGVRISNTLLFERYDDQINIVRATYRGRTASLLFLRGDRPKTLP